jgi:hypothetical protein
MQFTIQELEMIIEGLLWRDGHVHPKDRTHKLQARIRGIIENYCEHVWYAVRGKDNLDYPKCLKCGFTNDNQ